MLDHYECYEPFAHVEKVKEAYAHVLWGWIHWILYRPEKVINFCPVLPRLLLYSLCLVLINLRAAHVFSLVAT